jgi:hypothetical protein
MSWWVVMVLTLPIIVALGVATVIGIAVSVSAEEAWRRVQPQPWVRPFAADATADGAVEEEVAVAPPSQHQSPVSA